MVLKHGHSVSGVTHSLRTWHNALGLLLDGERNSNIRIITKTVYTITIPSMLTFRFNIVVLFERPQTNQALNAAQSEWNHFKINLLHLCCCSLNITPHPGPHGELSAALSLQSVPSTNLPLPPLLYPPPPPHRQKSACLTSHMYLKHTTLHSGCQQLTPVTGLMSIAFYCLCIASTRKLYLTL